SIKKNYIYVFFCFIVTFFYHILPFFTKIYLVLFYTFRLIKQVFLEISFLNTSTKSDNPLYIYVVFYIKIYPNRPPCSYTDNSPK
ncbi:hypothetical protein BpHYR1_043727, partial [Brachionus plicatilis]